MIPIYRLWPCRLVQALCLPVLVIAGCGNNSGREVGKDPRVPVMIKPSDAPSPEPSNVSGEQNPPSANPVPGDSKNSTNVTPVAPGPDGSTGGTNSPGQPPAPPAASKPGGVALTVIIAGLQNESGNVCVSMFNSPDGYPDSASKAVLAECFNVIGRAFDITIGNVPPGRYGIAMWHDENRDGKLNYNFLGIPKEGLAFSENGKPRITPPPPGPPSFSSISFEVKDVPKSTSARMSYLLDLFP